MRDYIPDKGDLIALDFNPQSGHEQRGRRPALVISNRLFNQATGLAIVCPITNTDRRIPFHLPLQNSSSLTGFVMIEQLKSVDFKARNAIFIEIAPAQLIADALEVIDLCVK